jgi:HSP20 family protein
MLNTLFPIPLRMPSLASLTQEMDQLFQGPATLLDAAPANWPGVNVWRDADNFVIETEIPGFTNGDVEVLATGDTVSIRGERASRMPENATALHIEQQVTRFERELNLAAPIDTTAVKADLVNGVLRITLPVAEVARARRIQIGGSSEASPSRQIAASCETSHAALPEGAVKSGWCSSTGAAKASKTSVANANASTSTPPSTARREPKFGTVTYRPRLNMYDLGDRYEMHVELPGSTQEHIHATIDNGVLSIEARVPSRYPEEVAAWHAEYGVGDFQRKVRLGNDIDGERLQAKYELGMLTLVLPKVAERQARRVPIQNG